MPLSSVSQKSSKVAEAKAPNNAEVDAAATSLEDMSNIQRHYAEWRYECISRRPQRAIDV